MNSSFYWVLHVQLQLQTVQMELFLQMRDSNSNQASPEEKVHQKRSKSNYEMRATMGLSNRGTE